VDQNPLASLDCPMPDIEQLLLAIIPVGKLNAVELHCHERLSVRRPSFRVISIK
jgi:hypothetical protein